MTAREFLDTNVILYAYDENDPKKQATAQELLRRAIRSECAISVQVLSEICSTVLGKLNPSQPVDLLRQILDHLEPIPTVSPNVRTVRRALDCYSRYGLHFCDGLILAAAEQAGCKTVWSEDMGDGQVYFDIAVKNPFS